MVVDGDTFHRESPVEAHQTLLTIYHEGHRPKSGCETVTLLKRQTHLLSAYLSILEKGD